jgi:hypothetical protein
MDLKKPLKHSEKSQLKQTKNGQQSLESHKAQQSPASNPVAQYHSLWTQAVVSTLVIAVIILGLSGGIIKILLLTS